MPRLPYTEHTPSSSINQPINQSINQSIELSIYPFISSALSHGSLSFLSLYLSLSISPSLSTVSVGFSWSLSRHSVHEPWAAWTPSLCCPNLDCILRLIITKSLASSCIWLASPSILNAASIIIATGQARWTCSRACNEFHIRKRSRIIPIQSPRVPQIQEARFQKRVGQGSRERFSHLPWRLGLGGRCRLVLPHLPGCQ